MRLPSLEATGRVLVTVGVAGVGMAAGFAHTHAAAVRAGQSGWLAWADAVVVELLVVVAGWQLHYRRRHGGSTMFPAVVMCLAFLVQMGSQVSGAPATFAGWLFAAIPALGALVTIKLVMSARRPAPLVDQAAVAEVPTVHADAVRAVPEPQVSPEVPTLAAVPDPAPAPVITSWPPKH